MTQSGLISRILGASKIIHQSALRGNANYIITSKNIGNIIRSGFYRTNRIMKIEKILKQI